MSPLIWTRKCGTGRLHEPPYGTLIIAGRASIRDSYNNGRRRDLRDEPRYGTEALTGRVSSRTRNYGTGALAGRASLRDSSLRGGGITGRASLGDGSASGTSFVVTGLVTTGRKRLRDEPPYGTLIITGRRRLRDELLTGRRRSGTSLLWDSLITGRRRLRDEPPYGTLNYGTEGLTGRASLRDGGA